MSINRVRSVLTFVATGIAMYLALLVYSASGWVRAFSDGVNLPREGRAFERLSEYNLFQDFATQTPNNGLVPYDIATPLFTDYASKYRFVYIPDGRTARFDPERMFEYPVGTILVKTFGYLNDIRDRSQGEELIETRLLIRDRQGWTAWTYVYDNAMNDAVLTVDGDRRQMTWTHYDGNERSINYIVPSVKDCRSCHNEQYNVVPIGPKAWNLNRDLEYDHGTENQLAYWTKIGYLKGIPAPEVASALPVWNDETSGTLDARARAYLEVNCAHCHNPKGPADKTTLDLRWTQEDPYYLGVGRRLEEERRDRDQRDDRVLDWIASLFSDNNGDRDRNFRRRDDGDRDRDESLRGVRRQDRDRRDREGRESAWDRPWVPDDYDWGGREFLIVAGKPDESIMIRRMESLEPGISMPKVPHLLVHDEGVSLIREWILAMKKVDVDLQ